MTLLAGVALPYDETGLARLARFVKVLVFRVVYHSEYEDHVRPGHGPHNAVAVIDS